VKSIVEKELSGILEKMREINISLQEGHGLYFEAKEKYLAAKKEQKTKEVSEIMLRILFMAGKISEGFVEDWQNGKITPTNKELALLKEGCNEVLEAFDNHFKKDLLSYYVRQGKQLSVQHKEAKQKIESIRELIN